MEFLTAAQATADPISICPEEGKEYPYGKVVDPAALLARLRESKAAPQN